MSADIALPAAGRNWYEARGQPTQALPKRSLFGSNLEKLIVQDKFSQAQSLSPNPASENKAKLPGVQILEHTNEQLSQQKQQACRARDMLDNLEKRSRYFDMKTQRNTLPQPVPERSEQKMSRKDLENASEINCHVGLNERGSFNYDKYGRKAPTHQYSLIGSALTKGMEFPQHDPDYVAYPQTAYVPTGMGGHGHAQLPNNASVSTTKRNNSAPPGTEDLPPNIRHQFGTSVCQAVLANPDQVAQTLEGQRRLANNLRRTRVAKTALSLAAEDTNPQYEALGLALRQNVFPGYTYDHKNSITKTIYSQDVHKNRVPDPDEFRYQRDELSTWHEHYELQKRQRVQWDHYESTRPTFQATWDRNAKRPAPPPQTPKPKTKGKPRPLKKDPKQGSAHNIIENDIVFEDIEFKTPPLTPLAKPPPPLTAAKPEPDDEFWGFYDQPLPLP